jgi:hypothetical protein
MLRTLARGVRLEELMFPWISMILVLVPTIAFSFDFRGLNLGEDCNGIISYEDLNGSKIKYQQNQNFEFEGVFFDRSAIILYHCRNNMFVRGEALLLFTNFGDAKSFFLQQKQLLIYEYGKPNVDQSTASYNLLRESIGAKLEDNEKYSLLWKISKKLISFGAMYLPVGKASGVVFAVGYK